LKKLKHVFHDDVYYVVDEVNSLLLLLVVVVVVLPDYYQLMVSVEYYWISFVQSKINNNKSKI